MVVSDVIGKIKEGLLLWLFFYGGGISLDVKFCKLGEEGLSRFFLFL